MANTTGLASTADVTLPLVFDEVTKHYQTLNVAERLWAVSPLGQLLWWTGTC